MKNNINIFHGNCLDFLKDLPDNSVDSVVTDPPYGLSFMGKKWDYDVPSVEIWAECLRVLKPGGHLLAFAGTRTQHRMAVRIEDAGFEIRDMIAWVYGSGFPKSLDVSKAVDKIDRVGPVRERALKFTAWMRSTGLTGKQLNDATGTFMGSHYLTDKEQPAVPTRDLFELIRPLLAVEVPQFVEDLIDARTVERENMKRREVVGQAKWKTLNEAPMPGADCSSDNRSFKDITAPFSPAARRWEGWGTALKPALEPITVARKPLAGTVAANVLAHGTGALNIDGCRVHGEDGQGRWPANLLHDGGEPAQLLGEAARFFYCPKASKKDREEGLDNATQGSQGAKGNGLGRVCASCGTPQLKAADCKCETKDWINPANRKNNHPTVKPTALMQYLCRLITPPGGVVLDPFMGSGSTGKAAVLEGFAFYGCELDEDYFKIAHARIQAQIRE